MKTFLRDNKSDNLILFFCGWGMDENPFSLLKSDADVLFIYDYTDSSFDYDVSKYKQITLIAFSYGVYAAGIVNLPENVSKKIAINGTLIPVHDKYGVPPKKFALSTKMDSQTIVKFRQRLFGGEKAQEHFEMFENNLPKRSAESCTGELAGMVSYFSKMPVAKLEFDKIYIGNFDKVVPMRNQHNFWQKTDVSNIIEIESGHFPFYMFGSFEEII